MDIAAMIRSVQRAGNEQANALLKLRQAIEKRLARLCEIRLAKSEADAWEWANTLTRGETVYCNASGMFLGGDIQRGIKLTFHMLQPRKKIAWFKLENEKFHWFGPKGLYRYKLQREEPTEPLSPTLAKMAIEMGKALNSVEEE
jgi:hypothetical protein